MVDEKKKEKMEEKSEEKPEEDTADDSKEGDKYETTPIIERAREEREKLEAAVKAMKAENDRKEKIMAKEALGGTTEAGGQPKKEEITDKEYAEKALSGDLNVKEE